MNRREFLLAVGATACGGSGASVQPPRVGGDAAGDAAAIVDVEAWTNLDDSPLAIEGDVLVERVGDQLWQWDLATMRRTGVLAVPARSFTVLSDRSVVAWEQCTAYRIVGGAPTTHTAVACAGGGALVRRAGTNDAIYVVRADRVVRFRFAGAALDEDASFTLPAPSPSGFGQIASLDDGRLVVPRGGGVAIVKPDTQPVLHTTKHQPRHLARAASGYWYSYAATDRRRVDTVVLVGTRDVVIALAPARIVHMATYGDTLALLLATGVDEWQVAVVEAGRERWRAPVPTRDGAVGLSATRLVLHSSAGLRAWDAGTGAVVDVTRP
ncbi:MAG: hypothetical protein ACKV2T_10650 [Kofleriaceae bacterium]